MRTIFLSLFLFFQLRLRKLLSIVSYLLPVFITFGGHGLRLFGSILPFLKVSNPVNKLLDISVFLLFEGEGVVPHPIEKQLLLYGITFSRGEAVALLTICRLAAIYNLVDRTYI